MSYYKRAGIVLFLIGAAGIVYGASMLFKTLKPLPEMNGTAK